MDFAPLSFNNIPTERIKSLKAKTLSAKRYLSIEQARIITSVYRENENQPVIIKRAKALARSLLQMPVSIDPEELIVGNRTPGIRAGVVFPEAGIRWLSNEIDLLENRQQDPFNVRNEDIACFREDIEPFWRDKTLEDSIQRAYGKQIAAIEKIVKINQKDHAQGHICPKTEDWLHYGPAGLLKIAEEKLTLSHGAQKLFYESVGITLEASCQFIRRYSVLASELAKEQDDVSLRENLMKIAGVCETISEGIPSTFHEALQSVWFLFVILHMESNASSFSPGRLDQSLYPFYCSDIESGIINDDFALELVDSLFIKFNQIVYMRNAHSAKYFAGFPIGFNVTLGGRKNENTDATNKLSFMFLKAQDHIRLPQPNLTARIHSGSSKEFLDECARIIGLGTGMPQIANDESIIPALDFAGIKPEESVDYALVGCVELSTQGNLLGWSDAAMFNMVKVLELTLNDGKCLITGKQLGLKTGSLSGYSGYPEFETAYREQILHFIANMKQACEVVEKYHQQHLPSPFLSAVIDDCLESGKDVTAGGARYNFSGIQAIQVANVADSLAVIKKLVFEEESIKKEDLLEALQNNFTGYEPLRQQCINRVSKYGNDISWVDNIGAEWVRFFSEELRKGNNYRGGIYQMGLYTVSAHVPMGENVGATPDGRLSGTPLADGGLSPMYGRDKTGPTAVLNSVARIPSHLAGNGALLNMKFLPSFFSQDHDRAKFSAFLRAIISLPVHHVQFNVVTNEELIRAKSDPESYRGLTIRVAGYTAYFTELAGDLQDEIIKRTSYGGNS